MTTIAATRSFQKEIMDGDLGKAYDKAEYDRALNELELINRLSRGYPPSIRAVAEFVTRYPGRRLRVLDIGYGGGDTLRAIRRWAQARKVEIELYGIDLNPRAKELAEARTPDDLEIQFMVGDVFDLAGFECDVMINSLFMHHLNDEEVVRVLNWMTKKARRGWFINDLHRHAIAYHFIRLVTPLFRFNRMICNDAPLSIARAFRKSDWLRYLAAAGVPLKQVHIAWHWPFRYGVSYRRVT